MTRSGEQGPGGAPSVPHDHRPDEPGWRDGGDVLTLPPGPAPPDVAAMTRDPEDGAPENGDDAARHAPPPEPEIRRWPLWVRIPLWLGLAILAYLLVLLLGAGVARLFG